MLHFICTLNCFRQLEEGSDGVERLNRWSDGRVYCVLGCEGQAANGCLSSYGPRPVVQGSTNYLRSCTCYPHHLNNICEDNATGACNQPTTRRSVRSIVQNVGLTNRDRSLLPPPPAPPPPTTTFPRLHGCLAQMETLREKTLFAPW